MQVATHKGAGLQQRDVLLGLRVRVKDSEDGNSFREGLVTQVRDLRIGCERIHMRVERRVLEMMDVTGFDRVWEFDSDILMSRVEVAWNGKEIGPRAARGVMCGSARAGV